MVELQSDNGQDRPEYTRQMWIGLAGIFLLVAVPPMCGNVQMLVSFLSMLLLPPLIVYALRWLERKFGHVKPVICLYFLLSASWVTLGIMGLTVGPPWLDRLWLWQGSIGLVVSLALAYNRKRAYPLGAFLAIFGFRAIITNGVLPLISAVLSASAMLYVAHSASLPEIGYNRPKRAAPIVFAMIILLMLTFPFQEPTISKIFEGYKASSTERYSEKVGTEVVAGKEANLRPLLNALHDIDGTVRSEAVRHLGSVGQRSKDVESGYLDTIIDALIHKIDDVETRTIAVSQLAAIGSKRAIGPLIGVLRKYPDIDGYPDRAIFEAFGESAAQLMVELLQDTEGSEWRDIRARRRIILALGNYRDRRVAEAIAEHLTDESRDVRIAAVESLRRMRVTDTLAVLAPRLEDSDPRVRRSAAQTLARVNGQGLKPVFDALARALKDDDASVRKYAAEALGNIPDERVIAPLVDALQDPDQNVRRSAARALGNIDSEDVIEPLVAALRDEYTRRDAAESLRRAGKQRGIDAAMEAMVADLGHHDPRVRSSAAEVLGQFKDRSTIPRLRRIAESDEDHYVRQAALFALAPLTNIQGKYWLMIGPFDNTDGAGFEKPYPPEQETDLAGVYDGVGKKVTWVAHDSGETDDLTPLFQPDQNVVAYALTYIDSPDDREVTFRVGSDDGIKVWLNDSIIWSNDVYRRMSIDSDIFNAQLRKGINRLLVKLTQGEREWGFHLRVTDSSRLPYDDLTYLNPSSFHRQIRVNRDKAD